MLDPLSPKPPFKIGFAGGLKVMQLGYASFDRRRPGSDNPEFEEGLSLQDPLTLLARDYFLMRTPTFHASPLLEKRYGHSYWSTGQTTTYAACPSVSLAFEGRDLIDRYLITLLLLGKDFS